MHFIRRFHIPALFCALAVLICELISRPYANMGIGDDGPYILVTQNLANTGHIVYNGWSAAMLVWQLYLGAAFIKLFGFSFTTVRMSTLLVAVALAFFLQRVMVRSGITERNATIGTLALVLSPLYLMLSATFMSDIHGLFAIVLCLYGCLRALQSSTTRAAIGWLCFAVATNAICGTSRQLAWLGILVMVPSTLWLLRARRRVFLAGAAATVAGVLFILGCMLWLKHQPYTTPEKFHVSNIPVVYLVHLFIYFFLDVPILLLPIVVLFLPEIRKSRPRIIAILCALVPCYLFLVNYPSHLRGSFRALLEPTLGGAPGCNFVTIFGEYESLSHGTPGIFLSNWIQCLLTIAIFCSLIGLTFSFFRPRHKTQAANLLAEVSWKQLGVILIPFAAAYILLLVYRTVSVVNDGTGVLFDRYALGLLVTALICLVRYYQDRIDPRLPLAGVVLVVIVAAYGIVITHNTFALYRARMAIAAELRAAGVPDTSTDNGWEYNIDVELQHADHINNPGVVLPLHAYIPSPPLPAGTCPMIYHDEVPIIHPLYGISFDPNACYGQAPFPPVHYSRWLASAPGTLYVIRYRPPSNTLKATPASLRLF
jgi:hypothetical protein